MTGPIYIADKETLDKVYNYLVEAEPIYGFIEHNNTLSATARIEYIGANKDYIPLYLNASTGAMTLNSWAEFPVILANKPYMVKSDGTPDYRLNELDYTKKEDGTDSDVENVNYDGGAFSWMPKIYKQEYMLGDDRVVKFSMSARDGFEPVGFIDSDNKVLEGVWIPMFYGSIVDSKMKCVAGNQPCYNNATAAEKTAIDAFSPRAKFFGGAIINTINDILIMMAKSTNSQDAYGYGNSSGYDTSAENVTHGVLPNAVVGGGQFYGTSDARSLNKIFHSVVLGTYQQWMRDPYTLLVKGRMKVSKNYSYDLTGVTYTDTGVSLPKNGNSTIYLVYPNKYQTIPGFGAMPVYPFKGSTSTGGCDGLWVNITITSVAFRFGNCNNGLYDGLRALPFNAAAPYTDWSVGAAILLLPPADVVV